jgi:excinuclease UvrABC nuclease subunit
MPFRQPFPRTFTASSVLKHAPTLSGVYGISNASEWIYIGETDNIQAALLEYMQGSDTPLLECQPTGFVFEVCGPTMRLTRQDRLVLEYEPKYNRHWSVHR